MRRVARLGAICGALLVLVAGQASAEDFDIQDLIDEYGEDVLELLDERVLVVEIVARVTENGRETAWNMELTELTVSGRAVTLRLEGDTVVVHAQFTPYKDGRDFILVAQGQTWVSDETGSDGQVIYRSAFESVPISFGEPVVFYPLGNALEEAPDGTQVDRNEDSVFNIELEVRIRPYDESDE